MANSVAEITTGRQGCNKLIILGESCIGIARGFEHLSDLEGVIATASIDINNRGRVIEDEHVVPITPFYDNPGIQVAVVIYTFNSGCLTSLRTFCYISWVSDNRTTTEEEEVSLVRSVNPHAVSPCMRQCFFPLVMYIDQR